MKRFQLIEWEDQPWLPAVFRNFITDHLRYSHNHPRRWQINLAIAQFLKNILSRICSRRIIDLCSGAGGPLPTIQHILVEVLNFPIEIILTDLYPNIYAFKKLELQEGVLVRYDSIDALDVPHELDGLRTLFTSLHHFPPDKVRKIFIDAVNKGKAIAIFEPLERTLWMIVYSVIVGLLRGIIATPIVGKMTPSRFFFTYLLPIAPAILIWDGVVSVLRTYTETELRDFTSGLGDNKYIWEVGKIKVTNKFGPISTIYVLGIPKNR